MDHVIALHEAARTTESVVESLMVELDDDGDCELARTAYQLLASARLLRQIAHEVAKLKATSS